MRFEEFKNGIMKDLEWTIRWVGGDQDPRTKSKQKKNVKIMKNGLV